MNVSLSTWKTPLSHEIEKDYFKKLIEIIKLEYKNSNCFPAEKDIFKAFESCNYDDLKIVIIGQDPYHGIAEANGLCFSVNEGIKIPPSLRNIFKELSDDLNIQIPSSGNLSNWATQGVFLLNSCLTVQENIAGSHAKLGWQTFTDAVIKHISQNKSNIIFMLWGAFAHKKESLIDSTKHLILKASHPSPLSANRAGWFGNKHFSKANDYLKSNGSSEIKWGGVAGGFQLYAVGNRL